MSDPVSVEGPVERVAGQLVIRIPMSAGGDRLAPYARGIGETDSEHLTLVIPPWLADKLRIGAGSLVVVDNNSGKLTITRSAANDESER